MAITNTKKILENNPLTFCVDIFQEDNRLDCSWFNPIIENKIESLRKKKIANRKLVKLKIIADVNGGKRLPKGTVIQEDESNNIPYIRATDVKNLKVNLDTAIKIPKEIHQVIQNYQLKKDDLVITIVGTIGDVGILENDIEVCDFTENIAKIRIKDKLVAVKFLLHYLDSEYGKVQTDRFFVGSLQYKLSLRSCRNIEVYLPMIDGNFDIKKQQYILNSVHSILKQAKLKKEKNIKLLKEARLVVQNKIKLPIINYSNNHEAYVQILDNDFNSRLDALFNNPLRQKLLNTLNKYPNIPLGKLVKSQGKNKIIPSDYYRLIELEQINEETGKIIGVKEVPELRSKKVSLKENSIIISKLQPEKGKIAIINREHDGCVGSSELVPIVLNSSKVSLEYLWAVLRSDYVLKQWEYKLTGSSRMRIGPNEIKDTIIPIPEPKLQQKIVKEIKEKLVVSDKVKKEADELLIRAKEEFLKLLII